jgi:cathepsin L
MNPIRTFATALAVVSATLLLAPATPALAQALPERFDWREKGKVTPVKDQGQVCGSCSIFAIISAFESSFAIRTGELVEMSERAFPYHHEDRGAFRKRCGGIAIELAAKGMVDYGVTPEGAHPGGKNQRLIPYIAKGQAWGLVNGKRAPSVPELKAALVERGPLAVDVNVTGAFRQYAGGVFREDAPARTNHAVTLIGWDDRLGAWLVKNSWGTAWGDTCGFGRERGYMWVAYGSNGIASTAVWIAAEPRWLERKWATGHDAAIGHAMARGAGKEELERLSKEKEEYMKVVDPRRTGRQTRYVP